jgi:hypothetical protein
VLVVRDDDEGELRRRQVHLQPDHRVEVEVVRRLVEEQQLGFEVKRAREREAHPPAPAQRRRRRLLLRRAEAEAREDRARARLRRLAAVLLE